VKAREEWRHVSVLSDACVATIAGQGVDGYRDALVILKRELGL
jgi:3-dehydroquinate dehydratase-2